MDLNEFQKQVNVWTDRNFKNRELWHPVMGAAEEVGELCHATLKMAQGICGKREQHISEAKDAIGDIVIYLADVCNLYGFNLQECIDEAWEQVRKRDWTNAPGKGEA